VIQQVESGQSERSVVSRKSSAVGRQPSFLDNGEFLVDTSIQLLPAPEDQRSPAVAFDGTNFLVVWVDARYDHWKVHGARVTPQGTLLDPTGFLVSSIPGDQYGPALAFDGTDYLVVWGDNDCGSIYGARVTPQGSVLDSAAIVISRTACGECSPAAGFDGANFLVVWQNLGHDTADILGARVTPRGTVLDTEGFVIRRTTSYLSDPAGNPAVGFDGANYLVAWGEYSDSSHYLDVCGARVTPAGVVLDTAGIVIAAAAHDQFRPAIGFDGANFLVAWNDNFSRDSNAVSGTRISSQGMMLDSAPFVISYTAYGVAPSALAFDGANFLVTWGDCPSDGDGTIYGLRVTPQGTVLDTAGIVVSRAARGRYHPAIACGGVGFLVAWWDERAGVDIYGARATPQGTVLDTAGILMSQAASGQSSCALAFDGTNFLVVWIDWRSGGADIYGARVTPEGIVLDPTGFIISWAAKGPCYPAIAYGGTDYLVVWEDHRSGNNDICGARVSPAGAVLDSAGIAISLAGCDEFTAVDFDGTNFLVVWREGSG